MKLSYQHMNLSTNLNCHPSLDSECVEEKISHAHGHDGHRTCHTNRILRKAHSKGKDRASEKAHDHQPRHLIFLVGIIVESLGEHHREDIGIAEPYTSDGSQNHQLRTSDKKAGHAYEHGCHTDREKRFSLESGESPASEQTTTRTEIKIYLCAYNCLLYRESETLGKNLRRESIGADIDSDMTHDADEA